MPEQRVALVVGNGAYSAAPRIVNPSNDARAMAAMLRSELSFEVVELFDADREQMQSALAHFAERSRHADVALIYYAGHGMEINNSNFLIPTNAILNHETDVPFQLINLDLALEAMRGARVKLVFLDACRDNPFNARMVRLSGARSISRGLAPVGQQPDGTMIAFATAPGMVALDGVGNNSPFAEALLQNLLTPMEDIRVVMGDVVESVIQKTSREQIPWQTSSISGRFYLSGIPPLPTPSTSDSTQKSGPVSAFEFDYQFGPEPGFRKWTKLSDSRWHGLYPSGKSTVIRVSTRTIVDDCPGVLAQVEENKMEVFIPDFGCTLMWVRFRLLGEDWRWLGEMKSIM